MASKGISAKTFLGAIQATAPVGGHRDPVQALMDEYGWTEENARQVYERTQRSGEKKKCKAQSRSKFALMCR